MPLNDTQIPVINWDLNSLKQDAIAYKNQYPNLQAWDITSYNDPLAIALSHQLSTITNLARWANAISQDYSLVSSRTYDAAVAHASSVGYVPSGNVASTGKMNMIFNAPAVMQLDPYTIDVSMVGLDGGDVHYTNIDSIYLYSGITSASGVNFTEGIWRTVSRTSNGLPFQTIVISARAAKDSFIGLINGETWTQTFNLAVCNPTDKYFMLRQLDVDQYMVVFGDNVHGMIPQNNSDILIEFLVGGGTRGNITTTGKTFTIESMPGGSSIASVTNSTAFSGGTDPEDIEHIKAYAPLTIKNQNRLVSTTDIKNYCESYPGVARARAFSTLGAMANVYIIPTGGGIPSAALVAQLQVDINSRLCIGHSATVSGAQYKGVTLTITVTIYHTYSDKEVAASLRASLLDMLNPLTKNTQGDYINDFGVPLREENIIRKIRENKAVIGISSIDPKGINGVSVSVRPDEILTDVAVGAVAASSVTVNVQVITDNDLALASGSDAAVSLGNYALTDPRNALIAGQL